MNEVELNAGIEPQVATGQAQQVPGIALSSSPGMVNFQNWLYSFHQGSQDNGHVCYTRSGDGGATWTPDQRISSFSMSASPSAVAFKGKLRVFYQGGGNNGQLWYTSSADGTSWVTNLQMGNVGMSDSPAAVVFRDKLYVFHQGKGKNGELWYVTSVDGVGFSGDVRIPNNTISASPAVAVFKDRLYLFYQGGGDNGQLWFITFDGASWSAAQRIAGVGLSASPSAVVFAVDQLYLFHRGASQSAQLWYIKSSNGSSWSADQPISAAQASWSPAAVEAMGALSVYYQGKGNNGQLWQYIHERLEIVGVVYDFPNAIVHDQTHPVLWQKTVPNNSSVPQTTHVEMRTSETETSYFENSQTSTSTVEVGRGFSASIPVVQAEVNGSLTMGLSSSATRTYGETQSFTKEFAAVVDVLVPPYTTMVVTFSASKGLVDVPYTMTFRSQSGALSSCQGVWSGISCWNLLTTYAETPMALVASE
jgi:hypothetical protein